MVTSIQISEELKEKLEARKATSKDTYEDVIWDMYEDTAELSDETKRRIEAARKEAAAGKTIPFAQVMKKAGL
jgi:predicted transcriptional regulator